MNDASEQQITRLLRQLNPEIWLVTAATQTGQRGGLIATNVMSASIVSEEPRVLVGIAHRHATAGLIQEAGSFTLHLLWPGQTDLVQRFGLASGRTVDKLEGIPHTAGTTGSPILSDCRGWLECRVEAVLDGGDRAFYLSQVIDGRLHEPADSAGAASPEDGGILCLQTLLAALPQETLAEMRRQREVDAAGDAEAIRRWRAARSQNA